MIRKILIILVIAAVVCAGLVGALAIIPHTHGDDTDHSKHATCPIYQVQSQNFQAILQHPILIVHFLILAFLAICYQKTDTPTHARLHSVRAPPALQ